MTDSRKLTVKSTDLIILRSNPCEVHGEEGTIRMAEEIHKATGALVIILSPNAPAIEHISEEEVYKLWVALRERFANGGHVCTNACGIGLGHYNAEREEE